MQAPGVLKEVQTIYSGEIHTLDKPRPAEVMTEGKESLEWRVEKDYDEHQFQEGL